MSAVHVPWRDSRGNVVWCDSYRVVETQLVLASWSAPQNIALAHWARLLDSTAHGPHGAWIAKVSHHRRFISSIPALPGWIHVAVVHEDALTYREIQDTPALGYAVDQEGLEQRVRQIVPVPLRPGWGLELGEPAGLVREVPGWGQRAWSISLDQSSWIQAINEHLGLGLKVAK